LPGPIGVSFPGTAQVLGPSFHSQVSVTNLAAWAARLKAMPGFALPYELIPSKDREFDPA
jgi:hypothetical protein